MKSPQINRKSDRSLSVAVVEAIAEQRGVDPVQVNPPLNGVVDPDALDQLFANRSPDTSGIGGRVQFEYDRYLVTVSADGRVDIS